VRSAALAAAGASVAERTAGGVHTAFTVAAVLSLAAVVGAIFVRSEDAGPNPAADVDPNPGVGSGVGPDSGSGAGSGAGSEASAAGE
jgi:hypothetical protein